MQAKMKDQADLAKWAAQRREERDAEKAKKVDAIRQTKVAMGMSLCAPAPTGKPGEIKPATNGGTDAAIVANDDQLAQAVDAALDVAGDALNDAMRASLRKEIVLRANLARSHQLLQSYIQQRRDVTKQCHNARAAEASEDEVVFCATVKLPRGFAFSQRAVSPEIPCRSRRCRAALQS